MNVIHRCPRKRRRVHNSFIHRKTLTTYAPNKMALNRLQKALINSHIGPRASAKLSKYFPSNANTQFFNTSDRILKRTVHHKFTLTYPKYKKKVKKCYHRRCLNCALYVQSQMLLHICHLFFQLI
jgi:hypothetical protein